MKIFQSLSRRVAFVGFALLASSTAAAAVSCGDTITVDTTLTADLACECNITALTVVGPATLNMDGYTVSCTNADTSSEQTFCITLSGTGPTVKDGQVQDCYYGIGAFGGFSDAVIKQMKGTATQQAFFIFNSTNNVISNVEAIDNGLSGIFVFGTGNVVKDSYAGNQFFESVILIGNDNVVKDCVLENSTGWDCAGVSPIDGLFDAFPQDNVIKDNIIRNCFDYGVSVFGTGTQIKGNTVSNTVDGGILAGLGNNVIKGNTISSTGSDGIAVSVAGGNVIKDNVITNAGSDGIDLRSSAGPDPNTVKDNTINTCVAQGIEVGTHGNTVRDNLVTDCDVGIEAEDGVGGNSIVDNTVSGSATFDLLDESLNCGTNTWKDNVGTGNIACTEA